MQLPSGTVTFLFTDIEGSTRLWELSESSMRAALIRHDAILNEVISRFNGAVFKTVGDAFCAAFSTAPEALFAAVEVQLAFAKESWPADAPIRVRMALHTGVADMRNKDYFGPALNRVSRLLNAGFGGQVLLTDVTHSLCLDALPPNASLKTLGNHRFRDLGRVEAVFQLIHPRLPAEFPALRSLASTPNNLPEQLTSFIGREQELRRAKELLSQGRLLTLTGTGGCGKTRLALQIAAQELDSFPDGVWLVELAAISDPSLVVQATSDMFGLRDEPGASVLETLLGHLKSKSLLILLDNCEHLIDASAQLAEAILTRCPQVTILASSREALGIGGERVFRVPSLSLPDPKEIPTPESISAFESVELFVSRARAHVPEFEVTRESAADVASVCRSLDGIPLALELAGARVRAMTVGELSRRLDHRFGLLRSGSRTALPRQQTLRALIDWSYDLLSEVEKTLLDRLSVFSGGWSLDMAEKICSGSKVEELDVFDTLNSLADKSLIMVEPSGEGTRYRLLETLRQYARDRLEESAQTAVWRNRHFQYFLAMMEEASPHLRGKDQQAWLDRLEAEYDNLRSAFTWSTARSVDPEMGLRVCAAIWRFWYIRGQCTEGRHWCEAALRQAPEGMISAPLAATLNCNGVFASIQGDYEASRVLHEQSLSIRRALGDEMGIAISLNNLGTLAHNQGQYQRAGALHEESLAIRRKLGDLRGIAGSLNNLATVAHEYGALDQARALFAEALSIERGAGNPWVTAVALSNLGQVAFDQGEYAQSRAYLVECLGIRRFLGDRLRLPDTLDSFASLAAVAGDTLRAARLWGASESLKKESGSPGTPAERSRRDARIAAARGAGDEAAFIAAWAEGEAMAAEQAIEYALQG
jgi:predicted ATPase/class 3 adenylate cyclase